MKMKSFFTLLATSLIILLTVNQSYSQTELLDKLKKYADNLPKDFAKISLKRKEALKEIGNYIIETRKENKKCNLLFICTHNSRRSQMGQVWGMTAAEYYGLDSIIFFSGGTEATAFNPRAVEALKNAGFTITDSSDSKNPNYLVSNKKDGSSWIMYSKKYNNSQNPQSDFGAILVCSEADKSCPIVLGASARFPLPYDDPKHYDNTPSEKQKYNETCKLIATEMFYLFDYVKKNYTNFRK